MLFSVTWVDPEIVILSEVKLDIEVSLYAKSKNFFQKYKWTYLQNKSRGRDVENKFMITRGLGEDKLRDCDWPIHTTIFKID